MGKFRENFLWKFSRFQNMGNDGDGGRWEVASVVDGKWLQMNGEVGGFLVEVFRDVFQTNMEIDGRIFRELR